MQAFHPRIWATIIVAILAVLSLSQNEHAREHSRTHSFDNCTRRVHVSLDETIAVISSTRLPTTTVKPPMSELSYAPLHVNLDTASIGLETIPAELGSSSALTPTSRPHACTCSSSIPGLYASSFATTRAHHNSSFIVICITPSPSLPTRCPTTTSEFSTTVFCSQSSAATLQQDYYKASIASLAISAAISGVISILIGLYTIKYWRAKVQRAERDNSEEEDS